VAEFRHVKRVIVSLWGHRVGMIVPTGMRGESYAFQYDQKFLYYRKYCSRACCNGCRICVFERVT
jgi:hypothetical protein